MSDIKLLILTVAIVMAPHMSKSTARWASIGMVVGLLLMWGADMTYPVKVAWWVTPFIHAVAFWYVVTRREPNTARISAIITRGIKVTGLK